MVKSGRLIFFLSCLFFFVGQSPAFAREMTDAIGIRVSVPERPRRIVVLMPSLGELVTDLLDDLSPLVGVSDFSTYPPALRKIPSIGPYHHFQVEKVVALRPDLVFASVNGNSEDQIRQLREIGIPVLTTRTDSLRQVFDTIRLVGQALGLAERGHHIATGLQKDLDQIRNSVPQGKKPRVVLQVGSAPLVVVGGGTLLNELLELVGAENPYSPSRLSYPRPSLEDVIQRKPDRLIVLALNDSIADTRRATEVWRPYLTRVTSLNSEELLRPTRRLAAGVKALLKKVSE